MATTRTAKIMGEINMPIGASCGFFGSSEVRFPVKVLNTK